MKKSNLPSFLLAAGFIAVLLSGCGKSANTSTEQPFTALFADNVLSDIAEIDTVIDDSFYEFGFEFEVTKNGKVTQLGTHIPDAGTIRITLWDLTDTSVITQSSITVVANTPKFATLPTPVSLTTGKKYAVTMLSNDYYYRTRTGGIDYVYPIIKGNVKITNYGYRNALSTDPAIYSNYFYTDYLAGIADITYETED